MSISLRVGSFNGIASIADLEMFMTRVVDIDDYSAFPVDIVIV